jgi:flavin-dependent dehydrogenase
MDDSGNLARNFPPGSRKKMNPMETVRIIGGGLAGLSLGVALRQHGVPTEIYEAGDYPRHRVCGEFITGLDEATIHRLGIGTAFAEALSHETVTWFVREQAVASHRLPEPARAISRLALDASLAKLFVKEGGKLFIHRRVSARADGTGWIETAGRRPGTSSPWLGLKIHARNLVSTTGLEFHLGTGAYVGLSAVEGGWTNVCGLFRRRSGMQLAREQILCGYLRSCGLHPLADRITNAEVRVGSTQAIAGITMLPRIIADTTVRLGDACAMIPPFTGNGMAMAFIGAALALDPLFAWAKKEQSWPVTARQIRQALHREFRLRLRVANLAHPFLLNAALQGCMGVAARRRILPFNSLYRLLH